jgi:hypothetical protein
MARTRMAVAVALGVVVGSAVVLAVGAPASAGGPSAGASTSASTAATTATVTATDPVVMAAGDIACEPGSSRKAKCRDDLTAAMLGPADYVLTAGDNQYNCGRLASYQGGYATTWGQYLDKTYPVVGEDEYSGSGCSTPGAEGFFTYFADRAQQGSCTKACRGWYSYDIGSSWHVVALNTACAESSIGGCTSTSPQLQWLRQDLAATSMPCVLAVMHRPYWSNGRTVAKFKPFIDALYAGGADVVLTGNAHLYARYAQQDPSSRLDPARGLREFIVGMGGKSHSTFQTPTLPNLQAGSDRTFGVLQLTLHPTSYEWEYLQAYPASPVFTDTGSTTCH